jgi:photosystem II stability/assembly factor-like uncharacterized protein
MRRTRRIFVMTATATAALAAAATAASANVQVGSSAWEWGSPRPQGNTLHATDFRGLTGYAVGDFGTLLKSADGGATWTGLQTGTFTNLSAVQAVDADTVIAGGGCVARRSDDGGVTFKRIAFAPVENTCREPLAALSFPLEQTGFLALHDGTVLLTTDGGTAFAQKSAIPGTSAARGTDVPTALWFTSATTGTATTNGGKIFQTVDAGNSWKLVKDAGRAVLDVTFVDALNGYAVGAGGLFLRTVDGGATWDAKASGPVRTLTKVRCSTDLQCVISTAEGDVLVRTTDGGDTVAHLTPSTDKMLAASFASPTRLVAAGQNGTTVISDDAGTTFAPVGGRLTGVFSTLRAGQASGSAFAAGNDGALAKTVDGGRTWTRANVATSENVIDVAFPTVTIGYALDGTGGLFRTADGGETWKTLDTGTTATPAAVVATSADDVLLVGPLGLRRSTDGGGTFDAVTSKAIRNLTLSGVTRSGSALVTWGATNLALSTDDGATWKTVHRPGPLTRVRGKRVNRLQVSSAVFLDARSGFIRDGGGRLWKTLNGGRTWTDLPGVGNSVYRGIRFSSKSTGYLIGASGFGDVQQAGVIYRTTDAGRTFAPQIVAPQAISGLAAPGGATDYLMAGDGSLFATTKGGVSGAPSALTITSPRTRYAKRAKITVSGRLSPATGAERVTVSWRPPGSAGWRVVTVKAAANGAFTTSWTVTPGTNTFVAQWAGDFDSAGDGSTPLKVVVSKPKPAKKKTRK